jgi:hypothetical protein
MPPTTRIDEIVDGLYRISTAMPPDVIAGGFTFNQFLLVDDQPLLHHTVRGSCSRPPATRSPACCRRNGCAGSRCRTSRGTSAAR